MTAQLTTEVGVMLRRWRERRRRSQLDLAISANVSARHVSFIETGRSQPSKAMILRLAEHLDIPMRDRNALLLAAGYAPAYPETSMQAPAMAQLRDVIDQLLQGYEPYPALVFDAGYNIIAANAAICLLLDGVADCLVEPPMNTMRIVLHPAGLAPRILNFRQVRHRLLDRLQRQIDTWQSDRLRHLYDEVSAYPVHAKEDAAGVDPAYALPLRIQHGEAVLSFITTVATFNTPLDITVSELAIHTFLPADPQTAKALHQG